MEDSLFVPPGLAAGVAFGSFGNVNSGTAEDDDRVSSTLGMTVETSRPRNCSAMVGVAITGMLPAGGVDVRVVEFGLGVAIPDVSSRGEGLLFGVGVCGSGLATSSTAVAAGGSGVPAVNTLAAYIPAPRAAPATRTAAFAREGTNSLPIASLTHAGAGAGPGGTDDADSGLFASTGPAADFGAGTGSPIRGPPAVYPDEPGNAIGSNFGFVISIILDPPWGSTLHSEDSASRLTDSDRHSQFRRPGSRVRGRLGLARNHRLLRRRLPDRLHFERLLHPPVLQRMKADDSHPSAGFHDFRQAGQQAIQGTEFVVDGDPQGLEGAGGRIDPATPRTAVRTALASSAVVSNGFAARRSTIRRATRRLNRSSPNSKIRSARAPSLSAFTTSAAD